MKRVSDLPIRIKLILINNLTIFFILLIICIFFFYMDYASYKGNLMRRLRTLAVQTAKVSAAAIDFGDKNAANELLSYLLDEKSLICAHVFDRDGKEFAFISKSGVPKNHTHPLKLKEGTLQFLDGKVILNQPIQFQSRKVGNLYIYSDTVELYERRQTFFFVVSAIFVLSLFLALGIFSQLQEIITKPIMDLAAIQQEISKSQDYSLRAEKFYDDELGKLTVSFNEMLDRVEEGTKQLALAKDDAEKARELATIASKAKSVFLSSMSHEIRTPLNGILGFTQILTNDRTLNRDQRNHLDVIQNCGSHLLKLINNILDIAKIESGKMNLDHKPFDISTLLKDIKSIFKVAADKKGLSWTIRGIPDSQTVVLGDEGKLRQILINLVGNAIKYTDAGYVQLSLKRENGNFEFGVRDSGGGIPPEFQKRIFDSFEQMPAHGNLKGTGLGLAIAREHIRLMGGKLQLESKTGEGSHFYFSISLEGCEKEIEETVDLKGKDLYLKRPEKVVAMLIDKDPINIQFLGQLLEEAGIDTLRASNREETEEVLLTGNPDVVFMDINMPGMKSNEALKKIQEKFSEKQVKTFAMTANAFDHERSVLLDKGFEDILVKPIEVDKVFSGLMAHLDLEFEIKEAEMEAYDDATLETFILDEEFVKRVVDAAESYFSSELKECASELIETNEEAKIALGERINELTRNMDMDGIVKLIGAYRAL